MIPSHWFRRLIVILFYVEIAGAFTWGGGMLTPAAPYNILGQVVGSALFLLAFYASGPLLARFLVPSSSDDPALQARVASAIHALPADFPPVVLYDHANQEANTVGLTRSHARVYLTSGLLHGLSEAGVRGVLAHELAHVRERHILLTFLYAVAFVGTVYLVHRTALFFGGVFLFLALRRHFEYRADAGAARIAGQAAALAGLQELAVLYPPTAWSRWLTWLMPYPTLPMRIRALESGYRPIV